MTKELWVNLPVKDVQRSKAFFTQLGFTFSTKNETPDMVCMLVGSKNIAVIMVSEQTFEGFIRGKMSDARQGGEVIFSFDAESREEVDEMAKKVEEAGGTIFGKPEEIQGWMYGFGFSDLDGHRWNMLHMSQG